MHKIKAIAAMTSPPADPEGPPRDCVICFAPYDRLFKLPKALGCGHVFCLECLARVSVATPAAPLLCPICRRPTALPPRRGPPALPTCSDLLPPALPATPRGFVRFDRPKGLLLYAPQPGRLPTVTLSLEVGGSQPPPAPPGGRGGGRWPFFKAVAVAVALLISGGLVLCGVFIFFLLPAACEGGSPVTNSTWGPPGWPPY